MFVVSFADIRDSYKSNYANRIQINGILRLKKKRLHKSVPIFANTIHYYYQIQIT